MGVRVKESRMRWWCWWCFLVTWTLASSKLCPAADRLAEVSVTPSVVRLDRPESSEQVLVDGRDRDSRRFDLTREARYESADPRVATVSPSGVVSPVSEGRTRVLVRLDEQVLELPVEVRGFASPPPVSFRDEILPILSKAGCNSGGCHGKAEGQNGFQLSVFGFDEEADHSALVKQGRGRRVSPATPGHSLLLRKATAEVPHGGGQKIRPGSPWHRRMVRWIAEGARRNQSEDRRVVAIEIRPEQAVLGADREQQLKVMAVDANGSRRCVTSEAEFLTNESSIARVDTDGLIRASDVPGEAAILVRYMGQVGICRVTLPQSDVEFTRPAEFNFIDRLVWDKLERLRIVPSDTADDATFLRRAYLDVIGTLPTVEESRRFLRDPSENKRRELIDRLLDREEYADYWAMRWADLLQVDTERITARGAVAITRWLRAQFRDNVPYDRFVRSIVTAEGDTNEEGPAAFYLTQKDPESLGRSVSQLFLGVRIECAQCHHHPFERWTPEDYYAFSGFFTGIERRGSPGGGTKILASEGSDLTVPRDGQTVRAAVLGAPAADLDPFDDRREALARWMTAPDNPYLAKTIVGRMWKHYFGRGLVEPVDDMRATNPASNEPLLDALAEFLVRERFDLKAVARQMLNSRVYQLRAATNESNRRDEQSHSHASWKPMPAEVLLDAICRATEVPEQFNGWPEGYRAIQVWDNRLPSYYFRAFGRPQRLTVCGCERGSEPSIAQALHLMNSPESLRKIRHRDGRAARLAASELSDEQVIEELYVATLSRPPDTRETELMLQAFRDSPDDRRAATEDVLWALLNTKEFIFIH